VVMGKSGDPVDPATGSSPPTGKSNPMPALRSRHAAAEKGRPDDLPVGVQLGDKRVAARSEDADGKKIAKALESLSRV